MLISEAQNEQIKALIEYPGLTAEERVSILWYNVFGFCGCGTPEDVLGRMRSILEAIAVEDGRATRAVVGDLAFYTTSDTLLWGYLLDAWGLSEHGSSVGWSWITDEGRMVLSWLRECIEPTPDFDEFDEEVADRVLANGGQPND